MHILYFSTFKKTTLQLGCDLYRWGLRLDLLFSTLAACEKSSGALLTNSVAVPHPQMISLIGPGWGAGTGMYKSLLRWK